MKKSVEHVEQQYSFLEKEWWTLRVGWFLLILFVLAGLLGLFGGGLFSTVTKETPIGTIRYERFLRHSSPSVIIIESDRMMSDSSVFINSSYLNKVRIEQIDPRPVSSALSGNRVRFKFSSTDSRQIIFHISPFQGSGSLALELGIAGQKEVFKQFIYY
ncbi:MAG TPA: hypothetical protein VGE15_06430 [Sphingobacteriaceae bacterium]